MLNRRSVLIVVFCNIHCLWIRVSRFFYFRWNSEIPIDHVVNSLLQESRPVAQKQCDVAVNFHRYGGGAGSKCHMKWTGSPMVAIWQFEIQHLDLGPHFGRREGCRGSSIVPLENDDGFVCAPHRNHRAISDHSATICYRTMPNSAGSGSSQNLGCSLWSRSVMWVSAGSEHTGLTNRENIFEDFQRMWSRYLIVKADGQTCHSNTALCVALCGKM